MHSLTGESYSERQQKVRHEHVVVRLCQRTHLPRCQRSCYILNHLFARAAVTHAQRTQP